MSQTQQQALQQVIDRLTADGIANADAATKIEALVTSLSDQLRAALEQAAGAGATPAQLAALTALADQLETETTTLVNAAAPAPAPSPAPASTGAISGGSATLGTTNVANPDVAAV